LSLVGVIPAAGYARRLPGINGSKEMLEIGGRPVVEYLVERMRFSRPDRIRIITREAKADLIEHARSMELEVVVADTSSAGESIATGVSDLEPADLVLLGFPDTIFEPPHAFQMLLEALTGELTLVLGLFTTSQPSDADVVVLDEEGLVREILIKPTAPTSNHIWGCAVAHRESLNGISSCEYPGEHFQRYCRSGSVKGVWLSDTFVDVGTPQVLTRLRAGDSQAP
jgi:NDP-sugar pyrophosphorylase family protein